MDNFATGGSSRPSGVTGMRRTRNLGDLSTRKSPTLIARAMNALPQRFRVKAEMAASDYLGRTFGLLSIKAALSGAVYRPDWATLPSDVALKLKVLLQARTGLTPFQESELLADIGGLVDVRQLPRVFGGQLTDYGILSTKLVTDAGVAYIVDAFQNSVELENMKYHGFGTGTTNEAAGDTALVTELTTEYVTNSTRPTGTTTEGASANIYRTVATLSPDSGGTLAITEHGVFSANAAGTLLDRSKFSAVNLVASSDSLQATYELTIASGG